MPAPDPLNIQVATSAPTPTQPPSIDVSIGPVTRRRVDELEPDNHTWGGRTALAIIVAVACAVLGSTVFPLAWIGTALAIVIWSVAP